MKKFFKFLVGWFEPVRERAPYRDVVQRSDQPDGEHIDLACGHRIVVTRHRLNAFPCDQCLEEGNTK